MRLYIKNMVCNRCIAVVRNEMETAGYHPVDVAMGTVDLEEELSPEKLDDLHKKLRSHGFELIDDKRSKLVEQIKTIIIQQVHYSPGRPKINYSDLLSRELRKDYSALSNLFSEMEGMTIEQYIIMQKIEKVKELLIYDELTLSQIAGEMEYSSVAHLSAQFKKVTGLTPSHFKTLKENRRQSLDSVRPPK
jgi:AraC-like DNA-binding protein